MCSPALGDTLLFSGALQDVRRHFPDAELVHFCMAQNVAAAELIPGADRRVVLELTKVGGSIGRMRAERLDLMLDFTSWQRLTAFYTMMAGARFTVGFKTAGQYRSRGYDVAIEHRDDRHEVENFRGLLRGVGIEAGAAPRVVVPPGEAAVAAGETDVVAFHLWASGARSWLREWPEDRWIELAQRIGRSGTLFLITGAPSDMERTGAFCAEDGARRAAGGGVCGDGRVQGPGADAGAGAGAGERKYGSDAPGGDPGDADGVDQWAEPEWTMGSGGAKGDGRGVSGRRLRVPAPGIQLRWAGDGLHGTDYGGDGGGGGGGCWLLVAGCGSGFE